MSRLDLDQLTSLARDVEPAAMPSDEVDQMIQHARVAGRAKHRASVVRRITVVAALSAAAAAALVTVHFAGDATPETDGTEHADTSNGPTEVELPTGDHVLATGPVSFLVESATREHRRIRLDHGAMLFDVRAIDDSVFEVVTNRASIRVLGTVFTVRATEDSTTVHVYEGRVQMVSRDDASVSSILDAGDMQYFGPSHPGQDTLAREARLAVEARFAASPDVAASLEVDRDVSPESSRENASGARVEGPSATTAGPPPASETTASETTASETTASETTASETTASETTASETLASETPASETPASETTASAADVRRWIARGEAVRAIAVARAQIERGHIDPWRLLEADALRAAGRVTEAADVYGFAARELSSPRREQAGFLEARLRAADDPEAALAALDVGHVAAFGSPLRERGLALSVELYGRLGRTDARHAAASAYLADYPDGSRADAMRELVGDRPLTPHER